MGVLPSTPVAFLVENSGSMPAGPRLRARQKAFAVRTAASEVPEIRHTIKKRGALARRLRDPAQQQGVKIQGRAGGRIERTRSPRGLVFPGVISFPGEARTKMEKESRKEVAIEQGKRWSEDPDTLWTDGAALPSGVATAAVVGYVRPGIGESQMDRLHIESRGCPELRPEFRQTGRNRRRGATYGARVRSIRRYDLEGGYRSESFSLGAQSSAFDTEV